jgi:hypothetical protein
LNSRFPRRACAGFPGIPELADQAKRMDYLNLLRGPAGNRAIPALFLTDKVSEWLSPADPLRYREISLPFYPNSIRTGTYRIKFGKDHFSQED